MHRALDAHSVRYRTIEGLDEHRRFPFLVNQLCEVIKTFDPDVVHVRTNWQLLLTFAAKMKGRNNFSIVYTIHGYRHNERMKALPARYLIGFSLKLFADAVIAPSTFLQKKFWFIREKIRVLPIGVYDEFFNSSGVPDFDGVKRVVFPGEFRRGKNQEILIEALHAYITRTGDRDVNLFLPGKGPRLKKCIDTAKRLGLADIVFFPSFVNTEMMHDLYSACQFAVIPSNVETFGHCITEPMVMGRVVISRRVGVAEDIIRHGENGFLFDHADELVDILTEVLSNPDLCRRVSKKAIEVRDKLKWQTICRDYIKIVEDL